MLDEFTQIRRKTNALALAVAVIIDLGVGGGEWRAWRKVLPRNAGVQRGGW